jgi:hypothetical protein
MQRSVFRYAWLITLLMGTALACNLLNGLQNVRELKATGQAVVTQVEGFATQNAPMIETARALATTQGGSILKTAQAFATDNPGLLETGKAFVTNDLPGLKNTIEAAATDFPDLAETMKAVATDNPGAMETISALGTRIAGGSNGSGQVPEDIPMPDSSKVENLNVTNELITYSTSLDFKTILSLYKEQMPTNGWQANKDATMETGSTAMLVFDKPDRTATLIITGDSTNDKVSVVIQLSPK